MLIFKENSYGGIDIHNEKDKFLVRLNNDDLNTLYKMQQHKQDVDTVKGRLLTWVERQVEEDYEFADFNSHLFSGDEICAEQIYQKILSDNSLVAKIVDEYRGILDSPQTEHGLQVWAYADEAISTHVSIRDILGEILCDKYPKELLIGKWRVNIVEKGDSYGEKGVLCHEDDKPLVEFYDMSQDKKKFPNGQFTSGRYYLDTLLSSEWGMSLDDKAKLGICLELCGGVDAWAVSPGDLNVISAWLATVQQRIELEKGKDVEFRYRGEVDLPAEYMSSNGLPAVSAEELIRVRLNTVPEFSNVFVEQVGVYNKGVGLSFTFVTTLDDTTAQALLKHQLNGLNYEAYREGANVSLDNTLNEAQERSRQSSSVDVSTKDNMEYGE